jgi:hypothetical protein
VRVVAGVRALAFTDEKVSAVASAVGYDSKKDFYRALYRYVGLMPKEIRRRSTTERIALAQLVATELLPAGVPSKIPKLMARTLDDSRDAPHGNDRTLHASVHRSSP